MATNKKTVTKKASAKKPVVKKKVATSTTKNTKSEFWNIEFNINTLYWITIGIAVISTAAWTYNTNQQISDIYDSVDQSSTISDQPIIRRPSDVQKIN